MSNLCWFPFFQSNYGTRPAVFNLFFHFLHLFKGCYKNFPIYQGDYQVYLDIKNSPNFEKKGRFFEL